MKYLLLIGCITTALCSSSEEITTQTALTIEAAVTAKPKTDGEIERDIEKYLSTNKRIYRQNLVEFFKTRRLKLNTEQLDKINSQLEVIEAAIPERIKLFIANQRHLIDFSRLSEIARTNCLMYIKAINARKIIHDELMRMRNKIMQLDYPLPHEQKASTVRPVAESPREMHARERRTVPRLVRQRQARERLILARLERERYETERLERDRAEERRLVAARIESKRLEREKAETERREREQRVRQGFTRQGLMRQRRERAARIRENRENRERQRAIAVTQS